MLQTLCFTKILFELIRTRPATRSTSSWTIPFCRLNFSHIFHLSQSWRRWGKKRRLFCTKFLIMSWLCLVLALCWDKSVVDAPFRIIMKHWWKMPPNIFQVLIIGLTMVVYLYNVKYFFVVKKGAKEVWAIKLEKK